MIFSRKFKIVFSDLDILRPGGMGDPKAAEADGKSRLEEIKYYTSMFLGALCIVCVFAFLFLVPFVLDPAISTLMHQFVEKPVHCRVSAELFTRIMMTNNNANI